MEEIYEHIFRCISSAKAESERPVVEAGSGSGELAEYLANHGLEVIAIDPWNQERVERISTGSVRYIRSRAEEMPLDDEIAGAIVSLRSLHHMDPEKALREFHRVLATGGRLCIADWIYGTDTGIPERYFRPEEIERMLVSSNFTSIKRPNSPDPEIMLWSARKEK